MNHQSDGQQALCHSWLFEAQGTETSETPESHSQPAIIFTCCSLPAIRITRSSHLTTTCKPWTAAMMELLPCEKKEIGLLVTGCFLTASCLNPSSKTAPGYRTQQTWTPGSISPNSRKKLFTTSCPSSPLTLFSLQCEWTGSRNERLVMS